MDNEELKYRFCDLGTEYYVAARLAARAAQAPVHGNILHHAIELYLKGALVGTLSLAEMKQKPYSHDLTALWAAFKKKTNDPKLDRFDEAIKALHEFESIRYPDEIVAKGLATSVSWVPGDLTFGGTIKSPPEYIVSVHQIDELVLEVLHRTAVNPKAMPLLNAAACEALEYHNPFAAEWRR